MQKMIFIWRIPNCGIRKRVMGTQITQEMRKWFVRKQAAAGLLPLPSPPQIRRYSATYILFICLMLLSVSQSCNLNGNAIHLSDPVEAGREFIDASLRGNYDLAKKYVLADSLNMEYFNRLESFYKNRSVQERDGYKNANIIIDSIQTISDSVTIINYSNTFKKSPDKIKLVRINKYWLVDFKFTFSGNANYGNE